MKITAEMKRDEYIRRTEQKETICDMPEDFWPIIKITSGGVEFPIETDFLKEIPKESIIYRAIMGIVSQIWMDKELHRLGRIFLLEQASMNHISCVTKEENSHDKA